MIEGKPVVVGEAFLNGVSIEQSNAGRSEVERRDELLDAWVRQHSRLVYRIAYAVLRSRQDAEDATQETFMRVLRHVSRLAAIADPKSWLARIAWRVAVDRSRRVALKREIPLDDPDRPMAEPASSAAGADENFQNVNIGAQLERLIAALPEKLRQPLILSTIEEMTPREVAGTLGINEAAVRSRVFRARQMLKEKLEAMAGKRYD